MQEATCLTGKGKIKNKKDGKKVNDREIDTVILLPMERVWVEEGKGGRDGQKEMDGGAWREKSEHFVQ